MENGLKQGRGFDGGEAYRESDYKTEIRVEEISVSILH
jgi:hypothetical protein